MAVARRRRALRVVVAGAILTLALAACSGSDSLSESGSADTTSAAVPSTVPETTVPETTVAETTEVEATEPAPSTIEPSSVTDNDSTADRPYDVFVPTSYDPAVAMPLVLLLHGYSASGDVQEAYFKFEPLAESRGFLYVHPDGTVDGRGQQFWNATDSCCAFFADPPDDAAYLLAIIEQVSATYSVDPKAIFLAGHSNGGFMSYRMACEHAYTIAGIASLAGATFANTSDCVPSEPVSVLQIHGTNDETIAYDGGSILANGYPSAAQTVEFWVAHNGCEPTPTIATDALDLDAGIDGPESDVEAFGGCEQGSQVELWTIDAGSHIPGITEDFSAGVVDFLLAHPKP